jgi:hypothetical protein
MLSALNYPEQPPPIRRGFRSGRGCSAEAGAGRGEEPRPAIVPGAFPYRGGGTPRAGPAVAAVCNKLVLGLYASLYDGSRGLSGLHDSKRSPFSSLFFLLFQKTTNLQTYIVYI